jgi:hypothetical protein
MSRDDGEYPVVAWGAQVNGSSVICLCMPTDAGFALPAEELPFAPGGLLPSVARDRNGDAWIAWWKFFDGIFWTHTYVTAVAENAQVAGGTMSRTLSWMLSEPAPETWWAVLRAEPGGDLESVDRVRAGTSTAMTWSDDTPASGPLRYRIRRESVDRRYEWLSDEVLWDDGAVGIQLTLVSTEAHPDRVILAWQGTNAASLTATVERRSASGEFSVLGSASADGTDRLLYEDSTVTPGARHAYRLSYAEDGVERHTVEAWVEVPVAPALALEGFVPNPSIRNASVALTLPESGRATLEIVDVAGRRVFHREVGALGAGRHVVKLDSTTALRPGVYLIRLTQGRSTVHARGVVTR